MNDLVSVIIPAYNAESFLGVTLRSVLEQDYTNLEVIVVDDGSTDRTLEIAQAMLSEDPRIQVIRTENRGVSAARNTGYRHSNGQYIAFLDADDKWHTRNVQVKLEALKGSEAGLAHSDAAVIDGDGKDTGTIIEGKNGQLFHDIISWNGPHIPGPSSILIKRSVLEEVGLFDEELSTSADMDLFLRISARYTVVRVPAVTWYYRVHEGNMHLDVERMDRDVNRILHKAIDSGMISGRMVSKARSAAYRVLGASWLGDQKRYLRGSFYLFRSVLAQPSSLGLLIRKSWRKIR